MGVAAMLIPEKFFPAGKAAVTLPIFPGGDLSGSERTVTQIARHQLPPHISFSDYDKLAWNNIELILAIRKRYLENGWLLRFEEKREGSEIVYIHEFKNKAYYYMWDDEVYRHGVHNKETCKKAGVKVVYEFA